MDKLYKNRVKVEVLDDLANEFTSVADCYVYMDLLAAIYQVKREALAIIKQEKEAIERFDSMAGSPDQLT